ncbi:MULTISPECIES: hypothetical protein [Anoxybacillaceae]|jgi:very-short-patch-repair endonuclease|uniref:Restriction endonuclease type II-like domain-containing protein n=1 Tax=Saccharococcus caldoxylosilyticus TaxID=81408 RepID=A0A150LDL1_9BACL|nr:MULTISPECIES: hypothetical protein [Parageobacillus]KYD10427.1 hypothetical protein B4119_1985 [Parageobacillus caldoxylosilyticus]BDG35878.1 hypothetical protein PcaKH15_17840 [Parageobacillus caldoxylosilyticus]BDG39660.1 hypothetical protein PcaKH16_17990 [Parageobacillus caldoxylosilyticus]BDG43432.1 hypothetical protein PcaKH35_17770 [Parageobacillus caldoxylosilyticus]
MKKFLPCRRNEKPFGSGCGGDQWHGLDKWEEDIERQRVLERVGWTFWRVRRSQFYLDPEKAMSSLGEKLDTQ